MTIWHPDPGDCIVCGAAHSGCVADDGPIIIEQLPATARAAARARALRDTAREHGSALPISLGPLTRRGTRATSARVTSHDDESTHSHTQDRRRQEPQGHATTTPSGAIRASTSTTHTTAKDTKVAT